MISFLYALHPSRSTITGICVTADPGDTVVFCDAYFEQRSGILRVSAGWGGSRRNAISRAVSREESVHRSRRYSQEKGTVCARPLCAVLCAENTLRLGRGSRFVTPVISNRSLYSLYFAGNFMKRRLSGSIAYEI